MIVDCIYTDTDRQERTIKTANTTLLSTFVTLTSMSLLQDWVGLQESYPLHGMVWGSRRQG